MVVQCDICRKHFDDEFRITYCPHDTFSANDGKNNFAHYPESYLESDAEMGKKLLSLSLPKIKLGE